MRRSASAGNTALALALISMLALLTPAAGELNVVAEHNLQIARHVLEKGSGEVGAFYAACMDEAAVRRAGAAPLQPLMSRIDAIRDRASLSAALADLDDAGVNALWVATAAVDAHGSPHYVAVVAPSENAGGYHLVARNDLAALTPQIDWNLYFERRGFPAFADLNVTDPAYLRSLGERLRALPFARLRAELRSRLLAAFSPWLPPDAGGRAPPIPRWKRCVALVDSEMPDELGRAWVARAFSPALKAKAERMVARIIAAMRARIEAATWLSESARTEALAKLDGMTMAIGYPDRWPDFEEDVGIDDRSLIADILAARAARIVAEIAKVGAPVDRHGFGMSVLAANAYYAPLRNEIVVPAGLLQPPLFGGGDAADYGAAGAAIGHEISHAFDERGRYFDADGELKDWWTPHDAAAFASRAACIDAGSITREEAVADRTGVELAYDAFERTAQGPGARHRFYDAFRAMWAGTTRADDALSSRCSVW